MNVQLRAIETIETTDLHRQIAELKKLLAEQAEDPPKPTPFGAVNFYEEVRRCRREAHAASGEVAGLGSPSPVYRV